MSFVCTSLLGRSVSSKDVGLPLIQHGALLPAVARRSVLAAGAAEQGVQEDRRSRKIGEVS